jgi:hypothetical protein
MYVLIQETERSCMCVSSVDFTSFYDFAIRLWKCSDSVIFFAFQQQICSVEL